MCTAASYLSRDFYFGRNFDYEISYNEDATSIMKYHTMKPSG